MDEDWLRFDFANPSALSEDQLLRVENEVNERILAAAPIGCANLPLAEARQAGAMMLFGEKYPDVVRVVSVGDFSKELCGGTHLANSAEAGIFKIVGEESVAAGTRRITALTGRGGWIRFAKCRRAGPGRRDARSPARRAARTHRGNGQGDAAAPQAGCRRTQGRADGRAAHRRRRRGWRRENCCRRGARRAKRAAAVDRPVAPQDRPGGRALGQSARGGEEGDADCRVEPRSGRSRPRRGGLDSRVAPWSTAAAAAAPTWPKLAANCRRNCPRRSRLRGRKSKNGYFSEIP